MTAIEMLVVLTISVVVFWVSANVVTSLFYSDNRNKQEQLLDQTKSQLELELGDKVRWAESVSYWEDGMKIDGVTYQLKEGRIKKGGEAITPGAVTIEFFKIGNLSKNESLVSLEIKVGMRHKTISSVHDSLRMVVSQRKVMIGGEDG